MTNSFGVSVPFFRRATVLENHLFVDRIAPKPAALYPTVGSLLFKPYDSSKEFIFCARHVLSPAIFLGLAFVCPAVAIIPAVLLGLSAALYLTSKCMKGESASRCLAISDRIAKEVMQLIVDVFFLPLSIIALATTSLSTGAHALKNCIIPEAKPALLI